MSTTTHPILFQPITSMPQAEAFLTYLYDNGMSYHCEDSAHDCIRHIISTEEANACDERMEECWTQDFGDNDPCGFVLELDPDTLRNMIANRKEDLARIQADAAGRDLGADENRECGELTRDIERMEKLLAERENLQPA